MIKVLNLRKDFQYAHIDYLPEQNPKMPYLLTVKGSLNYHYKEWHINESRAKRHFTRAFQSPKWGRDFPLAKWGVAYGNEAEITDYKLEDYRLINTNN